MAKTPTKAQIKKTISCALELLSDKKRWMTGHWAVNDVGGSVSPKSKKAVCWCFEGALMKCASDFPKYADSAAATISPIYEATEKVLKPFAFEALVTTPGVDESRLKPTADDIDLYDVNDDAALGLPAVRKVMRKALKSLDAKPKAARK